MPHRPSAFNDFRNTISTWTIGNVSVADDDDQDRLGRFLAERDALASQARQQAAANEAASKVKGAAQGKNPGL